MLGDFGSRLRHLRDAEPADAEQPILDDDPIESEIAVEGDATAKLVIIPISKEIAPDFQLVGYDNTIRRIEEVLTQRGKQRNVALYGGNGIGKTAITQGLVQRKNRGDLSTHMFKRLFYRLNTSRLLHRDDIGQISKEFDTALETFGMYDVLVIENFYTFYSYLKLKGATSVIIGLLEALSRRKLQSIITCNKREYTLLLNEIPELHEYFAPEEIEEPNDEQLLAILRGVHPSYEARYGIVMLDKALVTCRNLTQKYRSGLEGWAQPGRALVLLDRTISQFSVRMNSRKPELVALENEHEAVQSQLASLTDTTGCPHSPDDHGDCERLRSRLRELEPKIAKLREEWQLTTAPIRALQEEKAELDKKLNLAISRRGRLQELRSNNNELIKQGKDASEIGEQIVKSNQMIALVQEAIRQKDLKLAKINLSDQREHTVTPADVEAKFSELSGIPASQLNENERDQLLKMEDILGQQVFDQPQAIGEIAKAVRRAKAKLSDDVSAPKGSFLLLGPSGVGKTELCKALAAFLAGNTKALLRFDMSEYMEKHAVSRLIGAPPGYAGYDEGGTLTNAVSARPKAVICFDEVEKAHEDIFKIMLQVLSDGRLTDGRGELVDFGETYPMFTSNLGARYFLDENLSFAEAEAMARKEVERFFAPEFIGRLTGIICFQRLQLSSLVRIANRRLSQLNRRIANDKLSLEFPTSDLERFCTKFRDDRYGGRPILGAMQKTLESELATAILSQTSPGVFHASFDNETIAMKFEPAA